MNNIDKNTSSKTIEQFFDFGDIPVVGRYPLAVISQVRSAAFPATNSAYYRQTSENGSNLSASQSPYVSVDQDGGTFVMEGIRIERHRRFLDFIFSTGKALIFPGVGVGFMFNRRDAARLVMNDSTRGPLINKLATQLTKIILIYTTKDTKNEEGRISPLCFRWDPKYQAGIDNGIFGLDNAIERLGYNPEDFDGYSFIGISSLFTERFNLELTMRYHKSLDVLYKMKPETSGLARYVISFNYIPDQDSGLNDILEKIGAASGPSGARDRIVKSLKSEVESKLLSQLGISIEYKDGKNRVIFKKSNNTTASINVFGHGRGIGKKKADIFPGISRR
jgi:hypothetical protein